MNEVFSTGVENPDLLTEVSIAFFVVRLRSLGEGKGGHCGASCAKRDLPFVLSFFPLYTSLVFTLDSLCP